MNTTRTLTLVEVELPPDARHVYVDWIPFNESSETQVRFFLGTQRGEKAFVDLDGHQLSDGTVERSASIGSRMLGRAAVGSLDAAALRELAYDALAAADEIEALAGRWKAPDPRCCGRDVGGSGRCSR